MTIYKNTIYHCVVPFRYSSEADYVSSVAHQLAKSSSSRFIFMVDGDNFSPRPVTLRGMRRFISSLPDGQYYLCYHEERS